MLKLSIGIQGKTTDDLLTAIDEVRRKVEETYTSGFDNNESGNYNFEVSGEEEKPKYSIGDRVMVSSENDNENYDSFRHKVLIVKDVATNKDEHPGYDDSVNGMALYSFETEDGEPIHSSLYEYELESAE